MRTVGLIFEEKTADQPKKAETKKTKKSTKAEQPAEQQEAD